MKAIFARRGGFKQQLDIPSPVPKYRIPIIEKVDDISDPSHIGNIKDIEFELERVEDTRFGKIAYYEEV